MEDFKAIAKILSAIRACERNRSVNQYSFAPECLGMDEGLRDMLIVKLQKAGYIEGFNIIEGIDGQQYPIVNIEKSVPMITLSGLTFMAENDPLQKAIREMKPCQRDASRS